MTNGAELIGGPEKRDIRLVPYQVDWPVRFHRERTLIQQALGTAADRVDHIGSTAVPGLMAKPIIDIDLSLADPDNEVAYLPALERVGYRLRVREPGHRMVRTAAHDVHVHICAAGSGWERRHLLFRDWLRHDAADRDRYQQVKQALTGRDWPSMNDYAAAKFPGHHRHHPPRRTVGPRDRMDGGWMFNVTARVPTAKEQRRGLRRRYDWRRGHSGGRVDPNQRECHQVGAASPVPGR